MEIPKVFESEYCFCKILWDNEPVTCAQLSRLCKADLGWSRTTTYTVIKRLKEKGIIKKQNSIVSSIVTKEQVQLSEIDELIKKKFDSSFPSFISLFTKRHTLSSEEIEQIRKMIDNVDN